MSTLSRPLPRNTSPAHWARLRLVSDEGLLRLVRGGDERAFDVLVRRYDAPLHAFCRHMLGSREDAEDVMQDTWASAYRAMIRDDRQLTIRAWLYAIARNTCLNTMRTSGPRPLLVPVDVSDESASGIVHHLPTTHSAADHLADRERFRVLIGDIQELPENQRTALVLHELDALSYDEIAGVLDVSVGAVKSLLVRARLGLTESAEGRELDCDVVRLELAASAQKVAKLRAPTRAHVRGCEDCTKFNERLKSTGRSLTAAISPLPFIAVWLHKLGLGKLVGGGGVAAGSAATGSAGLIGGAGGAFTLKAAATVAAAALATAGAGEVHHLTKPAHPRAKSAVVTTPSDTSEAKTPPATSEPAKEDSSPGTPTKGKTPSLATVTVTPIAAAASAAASSASGTTAKKQGSPITDKPAVHVDAPASSAAGRPQVTPTQTTSARPTVSVPADPPADPAAAAPAADAAAPAAGTTP